MELKDFLPLVGVAIGWSLNEGSAFAKRAIERKRSLGKAIAILYYLLLEMVQLKIAQEKFKNMGSDVKEWERQRKRSFEKYTVNDSEFLKKLESNIDTIAEFYPIEAFEIREIVNKYQFVKTRSLDVFVSNPKAYVAAVSSYEAAYMGYQFKLEKILRFLAFRHSGVNWLRIRFHLWKIRRSVPKGDVVFYQQLRRRKRPKERGLGNSLEDYLKEEVKTTEDDV